MAIPCKMGTAKPHRLCTIVSGGAFLLPVTVNTTPRKSSPPVQTCTVEEATARLGVGRNFAYAMIRSKPFSVPVLSRGPQGRNLSIPIKALDDLLGPLLSPDEG